MESKGHEKTLLSHWAPDKLSTWCDLWAGGSHLHRWHQSFNQSILTGFCQVAVEFCMWLVPQNTSGCWHSVVRNRKRIKSNPPRLQHPFLCSHTTTYGQLTKHTRCRFSYGFWVLILPGLGTGLSHRFSTGSKQTNCQTISSRQQTRMFFTLVLQEDSVGFGSK